MTDLLSILEDPIPDSLMINLNVSKGYAQLYRSVGAYSWNYPAEASIVQAIVIIEANQDYSIGYPISALTLSVDNPVTLKITNSDFTFTNLTVNSMLFIDMPMVAIDIINSGTVEVRASITYATHTGEFTAPPSLVKSVNSKTASNGNITLAASDIPGVVTSVNGIVPDSNGNSSGAYSALSGNIIDVASATVFSKTITADTTLSISNADKNNISDFTLELTNGGAHSITWWANIKWTSGIVPSFTASGTDLIRFYSKDSGASWRGILLSVDSK